MLNIPRYDNIAAIEHIDKGWSDDKKYRLELTDGRLFLLKTADISLINKKKAEFDTVTSIMQTGIRMMKAVDFMTDDEKVYMIFSWVDGQDMESAMDSIFEEEQYRLGYESGEFLRKIHKIKAPKSQTDWSDRFNKKIDSNIRKYRDCGIRFDYDDRLIHYINENRYLLDERKQSLQHGDYHVGNLFLNGEGKLTVIDFNRWDYGDPWDDFNRIIWSAMSSEVFASAQIDGYFQNEAPEEFFRLLLLYISSNALSSIPWAIPFGEDDVKKMIVFIDKIMKHYDNYSKFIPSWYRKR